MNQQALATDNITEVLLKVIEFTQARHEILIENINSSRRNGYVPKDMPVEEFSNLMTVALCEHAENHRLLLYDSGNIKFGVNGSFTASPIVDEQGKMLLKQNSNEFLRAQIIKLKENTLNRKLAIELLKQKQEIQSQQRQN